MKIFLKYILGLCITSSIFCTPWENFHHPDISSEELRSIINFLDGEEKYCSWVAEYPIITNLIKEMNLKIGCEVGVAYGGQSEYFLEHSALETLYSIDPYKHFKKNEYDDFLNFKQHTHDVLFFKVQKKLERFDQRSVLLRETSQEAAQRFADNSLDFVYIDANHAYEYVKQDLHLWFDKVRSGGLIAGDDYKVWAGVSRAVKEFTAKQGIEYRTEGNKWWFIKP